MAVTSTATAATAAMAVATAGRGEPEILAFENSLAEVRWLLTELGRLLDNKIDPEDIAVSVSNLAELEGLLWREAELLEVPLRIHSGRPASDYPENRLFAQIRDCVDSSFSLPVLKRLLLNFALPWKNHDLARKLVRFGVENKLLRASLGGKDLWRKSFRRAEDCGLKQDQQQLKALKDFYTRLRRQLDSIYQAGSFEVLKTGLTAFSKSFLDTTRWAEDQLQPFQFALNCLDELDLAAQSFAGRDSMPPFLLWLDYLQESVYVRRNQNPGVPVYPYRLAAGICPRHHFIINASQAGTSQVVKQLPFLSIHEEERLSNSEIDLSGRFLGLYQISGKETCFSFSRRSYTGSNLAPSFFATRGFIRPASDPEPGTYTAEARAWAGGEFPTRLSTIQRDGFQAAGRAALKERSGDYTREPVRNRDLNEVFLKSFSDPDGFVRISPSSLEQFQNCPFSALLDRALRVELPDYQPPLLEALESGSILHEVLRVFFDRIRSSDTMLRPEKAAEYIEQMNDAVEGVLSAHEDCRALPVEPAWQELRRQAAELAEAYLLLELEESQGSKTVFTEKLLEQRIKEDMIHLSGRIDRIVCLEEGYLLIDYKLQNTPSAGEIFGSEPSSFQIPFYILLMEKNGLPVTRAAYYSMQRKEYRYVLAPAGGPKAMADSTVMAPAMETCLEAVRDMAGRLRSGNYLIQNSKQNCRYCGYRSICRTKYGL